MPNDTAHYSTPQYPAEPANHLVGYQAPDPHMNGTMSHGMPIHPHGDGGPGLPPAPYTDYGPTAMHPGAHTYAGIPYGGGGPQAQMRSKKGNRAQQVCHFTFLLVVANQHGRLVIYVEREKQNATRVDRAVAFVWRTICSAIIKM